MSGFIENRVEKATGADLNGDGYVGGEGLEGKIEVKNHIDFNRDGVIGRPLDTIPTANTTGTAGGNTNY